MKMLQITAVLNERCSPRYIHTRKSFSGRSNEIWPLKMILNFENSQFLIALTQKILQGIKKSFEYAHWDKKMY